MCDYCENPNGRFCYLRPGERMCPDCETELHRRRGLPDPYEEHAA